MSDDDKTRFDNWLKRKMKNDHLAFAQGSLFGDDKRVMNQAEIVRDVCEKMPYGYSRKEFIHIASFICWFRYPAFPRFMQTALANHKTLTIEELAAQLALIKGDLPDPETIKREIRDLLDPKKGHTDIIAKTKYQAEQVLKKRKRSTARKRKRTPHKQPKSDAFTEMFGKAGS